MFRTVLAALVCTAVMTPGFAAESGSLKSDPKQVKLKNQFVDAMYALHKKLVASHEVITSEKIGGYVGNPEFYREVTYRDKKTGKMFSRIQWEKDNPETIHVIELFFRDPQGRVIRDYTAAFLPGYRNAPVQTLLALHGYNDALHAFRSFDATGEAVFERCEGTYQGEKVNLNFEDYEIEDMRRQPDKGDMVTPVYQACFKGVALVAGKYVEPQ